MTNFLILAVMMVTLMGAASYGLVNAMRSLQTSIQTLVIQDRLEEATQGVLANIVSVANSSGQTYYVPAPDNLTTWPAVPSWITANAQTPRGVKFLYCPFSNATGTGSATIPTAINTSGTTTDSYTANIGTLYTGNNISSTNYVTQSSTRPTYASTALAILVAPGPNESTLLTTQDCLSVTSTGTLPGATVRIITEQEVQSRAQVTASSGTEFYAAASATNDGKASSASDYATFSTVMDYVTKYRPQRTTVDLKATATITVNSANMDESSVSTRQFSSVRNHSIYFNGNGTPFVTGVNGTFSPIILGNTYFNSINATAVNGQLYRPVASTFGNIIYGTTSAGPFMQAENLGRIIMASPGFNLAGASATTPTGNEMFYMERGGLVRNVALNLYNCTIYPPPANYLNNTIFYNEFGGISSMDWAVTVLQNGYNGTASPFYVGGDSTLIFDGVGQSLNGESSGSHTEATEIYEDMGGRVYENSYTTGTYNPEVYNRGGLYVISGISGYGGILPINNTVPYLWLAGPGATFGISSAAQSNYSASYRPTISALNSDATATNAIAASLIGGNIVNHNNGTVPALYGSNSGSTQCMADTAAFNIASGANNSAGTTMAPAGNIGQEAAIILNRTSTTCN